MDWLTEITRVDISTATEIPYIQITIKILCSIVAGGLIGIERSLNGRPVGIRTYCLVCMASVASVTMLQHLPLWLPGIPNEIFKADTSRVVMAIITGITFLCSGVVYHTGFSIQGLTTAASIWMTAIIGILYGVGFFYVGSASVAGVVIILAFIKFLEDKLKSDHHARLSVVYTRNGTVNRKNVYALLRKNQIQPIGTYNHQIINGGKDAVLTMTLRSNTPEAFGHFAQLLRECPDFKSYKIQLTRN